MTGGCGRGDQLRADYRILCEGANARRALRLESRSVRCATRPRLAVSFADHSGCGRSVCGGVGAQVLQAQRETGLLASSVLHDYLHVPHQHCARDRVSSNTRLHRPAAAPRTHCAASMCQSRTQCGRRSARHVLAAGCTASSSPVGLRTVYNACAALQVLQVALLSYGVYLVSRTLMTPQVLLAFMLCVCPQRTIALRRTGMARLRVFAAAAAASTPAAAPSRYQGQLQSYASQLFDS